MKYSILNSWVDLQKVIPGIRGYCLHILDTSVEILKKSLEERSFKVYIIKGSTVLDEKTFFDEIAHALEFPLYFGKNWGAWIDSLGDFSHLVPNRVAILWEDADKTFHSDPQTFLQAVCDLYNLAMSVGLTTFSKEVAGLKQLELFLLINGDE